MSKFIAVEGNIGTGKSSVIPHMADAMGWTQIQEPVDDPVFLELLDGFTKNPTDTETRLKFQRYITHSRAELLKGLPEGNYIIERSLFSDLVFSQVNMLSMERPSGEYLSYYYDIIDRLKDYPRMDAVVYLQCEPHVSYQRMLARGRDAEAGTTLEYLQDVHRYHEAALPQICSQYNTPLKTVFVHPRQSPEQVAAEVLKRLDY